MVTLLKYIEFLYKIIERKLSVCNLSPLLTMRAILTSENTMKRTNLSSISKCGTDFISSSKYGERLMLKLNNCYLPKKKINNGDQMKEYKLFELKCN